MFRPAEDQMERMAVYDMQRGVVHGMGAMLRGEEQQMLMAQMREMEMMQMQAMGCMPSYAGEQWSSPLEQQQQQQDTVRLTAPYASENATATTPSSSAPPPSARAGQAFISPQSATMPQCNGGATSTSPSTGTACRGVGLSNALSQPGNSSAYAPNSLYRTMSSATDVKESFAAQESMNSSSSMYAGYSMYEANNGSSMREQPAPPSDAAVSRATMTAAAAGDLAAGNSSKAVTPLPLGETSGAGISLALQRKPSVGPLAKKSSSASLSQNDKASTSKHRSHEIRRKSSELKRQSMTGRVNRGSRSPSIRSASAEKKRSSSPSSAKYKDRKRH